MDEDLYRQQILTIFNNLKHKHAIDDAQLVLEGYNSSCGDRITLYIKTEGDKIADMSFTGDGCLLSQVSAEMLIDELKGKDISEIENVTLDSHLECIGIHPTPTRMKCIELSLSSAKELLKDKNESR